MEWRNYMGGSENDSWFTRSTSEENTRPTTLDFWAYFFVKTNNCEKYYVCLIGFPEMIENTISTYTDRATTTE
jgi:hypothetical protein